MKTAIATKKAGGGGLPGRVGGSVLNITTIMMPMKAPINEWSTA
jgi:hypothetical protein